MTDMPNARRFCRKSLLWEYKTGEIDENYDYFSSFSNAENNDRMLFWDYNKSCQQRVRIAFVVLKHK